MSGTVEIVPTGVANTASVRAAFARLGVATCFVESAERIGTAEFVVLPGVGAFDAAMERLRDSGHAEVLRERMDAGRPTLAICLGMQLLGARSEEAPAALGLECAAANAVRFDGDLRVPHMGWSRVRGSDAGGIVGTGDAYFAHSFAWREAPPGFTPAWAVHGERFIAAVERGPVVGCQFHPELSGAFGEMLLRRWLVAGGMRLESGAVEGGA